MKLVVTDDYKYNHKYYPSWDCKGIMYPANLWVKLKIKYGYNKAKKICQDYYGFYFTENQINLKEVMRKLKDKYAQREDGEV